MKKILSMFLVLCMVVTLLPVSAMAEEADTTIDARVEIIAFAPLTETEKSVMTGTSIEDLELPQYLKATVRTTYAMQEDANQQTVADKVYSSEWEESMIDIPVTWTSVPEYDMDTVGEYVFTPLIEGYTVSATVPEITVTVGAADIDTYKYIEFEPSPYDAKIIETGQEYDTLYGAFYAVAEGQTIQLLKNIESTSTYYIGGQSFTLDLNNFTIKGTGYITIGKNGGGILTITDGSAEKGGKVTNEYKESSPTISMGTNGSSLEVNGGTVESTTTGYAIFNSDISSVRILGGMVKNTGGGGAIFNPSTGTVEVSGNSTVTAQNAVAIKSSPYGEIGKIIVGDAAVVTSANTSATSGTIELNQAILEITGGTVQNTASTGNAIYGNSFGKIQVLSGTPVIQGGGKAMYKAPDLSRYSKVKVTASVNYDGSTPEAEYKTADITGYKYLTFATGTGTTVTDLTLTDKLTAPATGGTPVTAIIADDQYTGTVTWGGSPAKFLANTAYTATVSLTAKSSYTFCGVAQNAFTHGGATVTNTAGTGDVLTVTVAFPKTAEKTVESIVITTPPNKLAYKFGERFSVAGMKVKVTYNDGTEEYLSSYLYDKGDPLSMSDTLVTITAIGTSITTTLEITVDRADGPAAPNVNFSFDGANANKLMGSTALMEYSLDNGSNWTGCTADMDLTASLGSITAENDIKVRVKETTTHNVGTIKTINITQSLAPTIGKTDETSARNNGTITGVSNLMEYKKNSDASYTAISGSTVTGLTPGEYLVRVKAAGTALASPDATMTIAAFVKSTPTADDLNYSLGTVDYDGSAKPLTVTKKTTGIGDITVKYDGSTTAPINAGTYAITVDIAGNAVTLTANYRQNSSGGDGGSGGGSDSGKSSADNSSLVIVTPPAPDKPDSPTQGEIKVEGKVDENGNATVNITDKNVTDVFDKAMVDAKKNGNEQNGITLVLHVNTGGKTFSNVTVNLPKTVQDIIIAKKIVNTIVVVDNPDIRIGMDLTTVKEINRQAKSDVNITAARGDSGKLTGEARKAIGSRPIFDLKVNYGSGKQVQSFGAGSVSVTIPYTLDANEKAENLCAVYIDGNGKVHWLTSSVYDSVEKVLRFATSHFSTYGIGYKQTDTAFTDIASHWAKADIEFVANRGLLRGTSDTTFSPNTAMTRGMFVTALGRLANADVSIYKQSNFSDVKAYSDYMGYIEWARKNGIVSGTTDGKFLPDASITREQMAVIMQNYAKVIGFTLPKIHIENIFADSDKISTYAKDAVKQMQMAGVLNGKKGNLSDPQGTATRAEVSAVLHRFVELTISSDTN